MPDMSAQLDDRAARRVFGRLRAFVTGGRYTGPGGAEGRAEFDETMRVVGVMALEDVRAHFREMSEPGSAWPELGAVTVVLRRGGPRIFGEQDIEAKRQGMKKLRNTNLMYLSLTPGAPGNALEVLPHEIGVRVGSRLKRAATHNKGGRATFRFDEETAIRLARNVSAVKRGRRRPKARADGRRHSWKARGKESPWNAFYFQMRGALRKMSGRSFRVPARPFLVASALRLGRYAAVIQRRLGGLFR